MHLQESGEMYLETIFELLRKNGTVRSVDIVAEMGFAKSSVSESLKNLKEKRLIKVDKEGFISLTEDGASIAKTIYERHIVLSDALIKLGVKSETAEKDACRIEHVISEETFEAIKNFVKK